MKNIILFFFISLAAFGQIKRQKLDDAVLLKDSTRVFGYINHLSDFILEIKTDKKKKTKTYFAEDVDYVMVSPSNVKLIRKLKKEIHIEDRDFEDLMNKDQLFGFTFILGNDTLMEKYSDKEIGNKVAYKRENYQYNVKGKTFEERIKSLGTKGGLASAAILLLLIL